MLYTVQICLDGDDLAASVSKIWEWLDRREVEPPVFRYRMTTKDVVLRLDFKNLGDAAAFGEDFHGAVLGTKQTVDAAATGRRALPPGVSPPPIR